MGAWIESKTGSDSDCISRMVRADGPAFLEHDSAVAQYWSRLDETFPDNQFCLAEQESGKAVGVGNSIPVAFEGEWADLPADGLDWVLEKENQNHVIEFRLANSIS